MTSGGADFLRYLTSRKALYNLWKYAAEGYASNKCLGTTALQDVEFLTALGSSGI